MPSKTFTTILLFVLSEVVGVALGEWFFRLYLKAIPPVALSDFNAQSAHFVYWLYGAGVGVVLFLWALLGMVTTRISNAMRKSESTA